ncbi:hypothetical protein ESCO_002345 [Escovopsis weberi]|uniref:GPI-anchored cupredoxin n=1 Tax=Escovopsis weberi TaxID=150374 RepID=A0A0M8MYR4_ESCWE|nr:hypothetical protein ESCO_002345 [Escovopsis weberi]
MHFSTLATVALSAAASAKIINVAVGPDGGLTIEPSTIQAEVGDNVDFTFLGGNHGLSSADFGTPCQPPANGGGFWTDFQKVADVGVVTFRVPINDTKPIWLYCAQKIAEHCQSGMVAVINPPNGKTIDDFASAAAEAPPSTFPPAAFGGFLVDTSNSTDPLVGSNSTTTAPGSTAAPTASAAPTGSSSNSSSSSAGSTGGSSTGTPSSGASGSSRPAATGNGTAPVHPNGAGSISGMDGVALAALGMVVALIA